MTWLDDIIQVLSNPKYPQVMGGMEKYDDDGKIIGKCALGELKCANNISALSEVDLDGEIMSSYKVPYDLVHDRILPAVERIRGSHGKIKYEFDWCFGANIQTLIYKLNDYGLTYPQICRFLKTTFGDAI